MLSTRRLTLFLLLGACTGVVSLPMRVLAASSTAPLITTLGGDAVLLRASDRFALAEGVALQQDDILEVSAGARLAQLEFPDGVKLALGPGSRALLFPRLTGERAGARLYLLSGWAKLAAPAAIKAAVSAPAIDVATTGGTLVLSVQPAAIQVFAETGEVSIRRDGAAAQGLTTGQLLSLSTSDGAKPEIASRPTPAFIAALPRAFMDALPARAAKFQGHPVVPHGLGPLALADAQPWLDAEPGLRRANLPRWRNAARDEEFRRALAEGVKSHPEWEPVLTPKSTKKAAP